MIINCEHYTLCKSVEWFFSVIIAKMLGVPYE